MEEEDIKKETQNIQTANDKVVDVDLLDMCVKCNSNQAKELHECPFEKEIHGNDKTECNCCDDCTYDCYMEI